MRTVGIEPITYPYYDPKTIGLAFDEMLNSIRSAVPRSVFLLHACAHNPTGVDPTHEQWGKIADAVLEKGHYAFFDCAYQGFASGDLDADAWAVREFVRRGVPMLVCQVRKVVMGAFFCIAPSPSVHLGEMGVLMMALLLLFGFLVMPEFCKERGVVWGAGRRSACHRADKGSVGQNFQPVVCACSQ